MSLRVLAREAGVSHQYIDFLEKGQRHRLDVEMLRKVAGALGVELDELLGETWGPERDRERERGGDIENEDLEEIQVNLMTTPQPTSQTSRRLTRKYHPISPSHPDHPAHSLLQAIRVKQGGMSGRAFAQHLGVNHDLWAGALTGRRPFGGTLLAAIVYHYPDLDRVVCDYLRSPGAREEGSLMALNPRQRKIRAQLAANVRVSKPEYDGREATAQAKAAYWQKREEKVDPEGRMTPERRRQAAVADWQADMLRAKLQKSIHARSHSGSRAGRQAANP